jgi:hypothetical protein
MNPIGVAWLGCGDERKGHLHVPATGTNLLTLERHE